MEVLNGNQSDPQNTRRRQDQYTAHRRFLDWSSRDSDILLCPHSPLALADVLSLSGNYLDLVSANQPDENQTPNLSQQKLAAEEPNQLQQRRQRRHPRTRANLLTQLEQATLVSCCKKIQLENALVKQPGIQHLYLVAGFLEIEQEQGNKTRAPLLFYPVTLVRKKSEKTDKERTDDNNQDRPASANYELRIDSAVPDTNTELMQWCERNAQCALPEFDDASPLQDYFTQVAAAISNKDRLELEFNMALGTAISPEVKQAEQAAVQLPELPEHFDASLARAITHNKNLEQLSSVLNLLKDYSTDTVAVHKLSPAANESSQAITELRKYSKMLAEAGFQDVEFQHLPALPDNINLWTQNVGKALQSKMIRELLDTPNISARHLIRLAGVIELIDKAPMTLEQYKHADLCYSATPALLKRARHQARLIEDELASLQSTFVLDKVPAKKQLLSLIEELGVNLEHEPDIVDAEYFNARRQFMEFSIEKPTNLTPEHRSRLGKLAKVLRFRELFVNNTEYRLALGPGYRGLRTDWEALEQMVEYSQELSEVLETESLAAAAMANWEEFRSCYVNELEVLQIAAESLRKLLWVCGSTWQNRPTSDVLEQAKLLRKKLIAWADMHTVLDQHAAKTPAIVLAQFSGKSREDVITEIHVGETQARIDEHLSASGASSTSVVETIEWLRCASQTASEHHLEIKAIVEHLQIA